VRSEEVPGEEQVWLPLDVSWLSSVAPFVSVGLFVLALHWLQSPPGAHPALKTCESSGTGQVRQCVCFILAGCTMPVLGTASSGPALAESSGTGQVGVYPVVSSSTGSV
jgi:hypothetical protein